MRLAIGRNTPKGSIPFLIPGVSIYLNSTSETIFPLSHNILARNVRQHGAEKKVNLAARELPGEGFMVHCQSVESKQVGSSMLSRKIVARKSEATGNSVCDRLDLETLKPFEVVEDQFQRQGILFRNAIALQPSNSAYPPRSGRILLMGAPCNGWMEIIFKEPTRFFNCHVTSSRRLVLSAYDCNNRLLTSDELPQANLATFDSPLPPNVPLAVIASEIARITLYAFDGQFAIDDISFCNRSF
ncbi:MAG: hypothetical protein SW833_05565 [Cyanobacteriota bacterium]|nr:hypothetical protein [Cyanobacteriota bacterium]